VKFRIFCKIFPSKIAQDRLQENRVVCTTHCAHLRHLLVQVFHIVVTHRHHVCAVVEMPPDRSTKLTLAPTAATEILLLTATIHAVNESDSKIKNNIKLLSMHALRRRLKCSNSLLLYHY